MSLKTWKEEFYPINASEISEENALAHCLKKWQGLSPENMAKHGVVHGYNRIIADRLDHLEITTVSCALCKHYYPECTKCPFVKMKHAKCYSSGMPYDLYLNDHSNTQPMIDMLEEMHDQLTRTVDNT